MFTIIISFFTIFLIILSIVFMPKLKIRNFTIQPFWILACIGALLIIITRGINIDEIQNLFLTDYASNPLKTLILFFAMTVLSVFLDDIGLFRFIANKTIQKCSTQLPLFLSLYAIISLLTIFTSNDIIILTFTPFICCFTKSSKINPTPYIILEFVCANTLSMMLLIGNPTNIFLSTAYNINFFSYFQTMFLPTIGASIISLCLMLILFWKDLHVKITNTSSEIELPNLPLMIIGLAHLLGTIILLSIAHIIHVELYLITVSAVVSLLLSLVVYHFGFKKDISLRFFKRLPYQLIPFIISMMIIVLSLRKTGITEQIFNLLSGSPVFTYGYSSLVCANIFNNIPMTLFFSDIINSFTVVSEEAIYATIIGSNIGAFLTPIGALAGIMLFSILKQYQVELKYPTFIKYGVIIGLPSITVSLVILNIIL